MSHRNNTFFLSALTTNKTHRNINITYVKIDKFTHSYTCCVQKFKHSLVAYTLIITVFRLFQKKFNFFA